MSDFYNIKTLVFLFCFSFIGSLRIRARDEMDFFCIKNTYYFEIHIYFDEIDDLETISKNACSFILEMAYPKGIQFKCFINLIDDKISCSSNLENFMITLKEGDMMELPYPFPELEGIEWDYNSFLNNVYRKLWRVEGSCGNNTTNYDLESINVLEWDLVTEIINITSIGCESLQKKDENNYMFKMMLNIIDGGLKNLLEGAKIKNEEYNIFPLQEIWVKFSFLKRNEEEISSHKGNEHLFAHCNFTEKINQKNILGKEKIQLYCYIPIKDNSIIIGPIIINSFYDSVYFRLLNSTTNTAEIIKGNIYFNTIRTIQAKKETEIPKTVSNDNKTDLNGLEINQTISKEIKITNETVKEFILGDLKKPFFCPEKPIFRIKYLKTDIFFESLFSDGKTYSFKLRGNLLNGFEYNKEGNLIPLISTNEEYVFNLTITDNLAEEEEIKRTQASCAIPRGSLFGYDSSLEIRCIGKKLSKSSEINGTDITLNWGLEENKNFKNIIIGWPTNYIGSHIKNLYSYSIDAYSILHSNYGCYDNQFYFFISIYNLNFEPQISFDLPLKYPIEPKAKCKMYDSSTLKCALNLKYNKIFAHDKISLFTNINQEIITDEGNLIYFRAESISSSEEDNDFLILTKEDCGTYRVFGAMKNIGIGASMTLGIFIGILTFFLLVVCCFCCCIIYKIKNRNRKGKYFAHIEEESTSKKNVINRKN